MLERNTFGNGPAANAGMIADRHPQRPDAARLILGDTARQLYRLD